MKKEIQFEETGSELVYSENGLKMKIFRDDQAESPDQWGDKEAFIVYDHRQFYVKREGFDPDEIFEVFQTKNIYEGFYIFPLFAYIHSGVALSLGRSQYPFNDRWDTSFKGFVLVKRQKGSGTQEKARKIAQGIVETWNMYLSGDVYGFILEDKNGNHLDSCFGFYGLDAVKDEAESMLQSHLDKQKKDHFARLKAWIKKQVPFEKRKSFAIQ